MNVRNCPNCGRLFNFIRTDLCPVCIEEQEKEFTKVRDYLRSHPNVSLIELSEATEVEEEKIIRWIQEGRIEAKRMSEAPIKCDKCGTGIYSGTRCDACNKGLLNEFSKVGKELQAQLDAERNRPKFHSRRS